MWKLLLAFVAFAALAMFVLIQSGGDIDMGGEKHGIEVEHNDAASAPAQASAPASAPEAAATLPASAASAASQ